MNGASQPTILKADTAGVAKAIDVLGEGGLVAMPTETVYGLAARADSDAAIARIYRAKGRPDFNPLIVHVADVAQAKTLAHLDDRAERLAAAFWPGALTLVVPLRAGAPVAQAVTAGLPTIALRCPAHPVMRAVLAESGLALAAPSANASGKVSPTMADHVARSLGGNVGLILDGGPCAAGIESTIVALREGGGWQVLRHGPVTESRIRGVLDRDADAMTSNRTFEAPGQLASHYAPGKPMRLDAERAQPDEYHIGFADVRGDETLSATGDLAEAAARLYLLLHRAAESGKRRIAVAPVPSEGIGVAINDRLRRAAADMPAQ